MFYKWKYDVHKTHWHRNSHSDTNKRKDKNRKRSTKNNKLWISLRETFVSWGRQDGNTLESYSYEAKKASNKISAPCTKICSNLVWLKKESPCIFLHIFESKDSQSIWGKYKHTHNRLLKRQPTQSTAAENCTHWVWLKTVAGSTRHCAQEADESSRPKAQASSFDPLAQGNFQQWSAAHWLRMRSLLQTGPLNKLTLEGRAKNHLCCLLLETHGTFLWLYLTCAHVSCFCWALKDDLCVCFNVIFCCFGSPFKIKQATLPHIFPGEETKKQHSRC